MFFLQSLTLEVDELMVDVTNVVIRDMCGYVCVCVRVRVRL